MVEIREVKNLKDLRKFIDFAYKHYAGNQYWVPPLRSDEWNTLRPDKNPAFADCEAQYWLAYRDGKIVGRIAGIINHRYEEVWGKKQARFGWIEFIDDPEISRALLKTVEEWAREKGMEAVQGPMGFCDLDREGMLVEGFEELSTLATIYNYPYYPVHMEQLGYRKDIDAVEYELKVPDEIPERLLKINDAILKRSRFHIAQAKKPKDLLPYVPGIFKLVNEAYAPLYGVVPLNDAQIKAYTKQYFSFINPDFVKIILDENDQVVAFGITMPSLSRALQKCNGRLFPFGFIPVLHALKHNPCIDLYLIAIRPDLQGKGINSLMMTEITRSAIENAVTRAESNPELEVNSKVQSLWKNYDARQHKRRRFYIKELN